MTHTLCAYVTCDSDGYIDADIICVRCDDENTYSVLEQCLYGWDSHAPLRELDLENLDGDSVDCHGVEHFYRDGEWWVYGLQCACDLAMEDDRFRDGLESIAMDMAPSLTPGQNSPVTVPFDFYWDERDEEWVVKAEQP